MIANLTVLLATLFAVSARSIADYDLNKTITTLELIERDGYPGERHRVETSDGYILGVYHIPYGRKCGQDRPRKAPVLVQHGILSNAIDFLVAGPEDSLGYILADACYDVWLGNSRGNFESKEHTSIPNNASEFWQFSWHEMGQYDLPAVIDFILETTGQPKLHYIGHSQGTTQFFVYSSMNPEESAQKVISMHALAPIAFMENLTSPIIQFTAQYVNQLETLFDIFGWDQFLPPLNLIEGEGGNACTDEHPNIEYLCENLLFLVCGYDPEQWNADLLPLIVQHDPAGASTKQLVHYGQEVHSAEFRRYDHGTVGNILHYGQAQPPNYRIQDIQLPLYLHYSDNDWLASVLDVERFADIVPNATKLKVPLEKFNHLDYLWAIDVRSLVYDPLMEILDQS